MDIDTCNENKILYKERENMWYKAVAALFFTFIISFVSIMVIGNILDAIFDYSKSAEISYNLVTHGLSVGIIFTIVFCTLIIVEKLDR